MSQSPLILSTQSRRIEAEDADCSASRFVDTSLRQAVFRSTDLSAAVFTDVKMRDARFANFNAGNAVFENGDLRGAAITDCRLDGMTIDGIAVTALLAAYRGAG